MGKPPTSLFAALYGNITDRTCLETPTRRKDPRSAKQLQSSKNRAMREENISWKGRASTLGTRHFKFFFFFFLFFFFSSFLSAVVNIIIRTRLYYVGGFSVYQRFFCKEICQLFYEPNALLLCLGAHNNERSASSWFSIDHIGTILEYI